MVLLGESGGVGKPKAYMLELVPGRLPGCTN